MVELDLLYKIGRRSIREQAKYLLEQIQRNVSNRAWWYFEFTNRILPLLALETRKASERAVDLGAKEWDNLIILDACRFDAFSVMINRHPKLFENLEYSLTKLESLGTCTPEFLFANFSGKRFSDVIYVSCNPYVSTILPQGTFFKVVDAWSTNWDDHFHTVMPYDAAKIALRVKHDYTDKRLIVHLMQPHTPFIGKRRPAGQNFWDIALNQGLAAARDAYMDNLEVVLPYALALQSSLGGRTVITSDHGDAWGERESMFGVPIFGHPCGVHIPALINVPWMLVSREKGLLKSESEYLKALIRLAKLRSGIR